MCILFLFHALEHPDDPGSSGDPLDLNYQPHRSPGVTTRSSANSISAGHGNRGVRDAVKGGPISKRYKLIVASNRDEVMDRPTAPMHFWKDGESNLLAGRDLRAGGTWLGVSRCGKFGSLTNITSTWGQLLVFAENHVKSTCFASAAMMIAAAAAAAVPLVQPQAIEEGGTGSAARSSAVGVAAGMLLAGLVTASVGIASARRRASRRSRGELVSEFLKKGSQENAEQYCKRLYKERWRYEGFNLVLADSSGAWVVSNEDEAGVTRLPPGVYGISNGTLDEPWPKLLHGKSRVLDVLMRVSSDPTVTEDGLVDLLMDVLADERHCPAAVPAKRQRWRLGHSTRGSDMQRVCIPPTPIRHFGSKHVYGTRSQTVVLVHESGRMKVVERNLTEGVPMGRASRNAFDFCDI